MEKYYTILTQIGQEKVSLAITGEATLELGKFKIGDGGGADDFIINESQTDLINPVYEGLINRKEREDDSLMLELIVPPDIGDFTIREVGIYTKEGDLFALSKYPPTYKPIAGGGAVSKTLVIRLFLKIAASDNVIINISDITFATIDYVDSIRDLIPLQATQAEALEGINESKFISPKTLQEIKATQEETLDGNAHNKFITPEVLKHHLRADRTATTAETIQPTPTSDNKFISPIALQNKAATEEEIIEGVTNYKFITPLKLKQKIATANETIAGTDNNKFITPLRLQEKAAATQEILDGNIAHKFITPLGLQQKVATSEEAVAGVNNNKLITPVSLRQAYVMVPLGAIIWYTGTVAPIGFLACGGYLLSRAEYPELWQFAKNSGNIRTEATWMNNDYQGGFSYGNGGANTGTTFRIPLLYGEFIRGWDNGRGVDTGRRIGEWQASVFAQTAGAKRVEACPRNVALLPIIKIW